MAVGLKVAMIGGTGTLGRPVVRRLAADGMSVRVMSRNIDRARTVLPEGVEIVQGDALDGEAVGRAVRGAEAVYVNLATPYSPKAMNTDLEGTRIAVTAAKREGVAHFLRISAMGVPEGSHMWWSIREKQIADQMVIDSGIDCTIFRPTWFMESLPLFAMGRLMIRVPAPDKPLWWIAGEDYARQVSSALHVPGARNRVFMMQGPEGVSIREAVRRFVRAARPMRRMTTLRMPGLALAAASWFSHDLRYLRDLMEMSFGHTTAFQSKPAWDVLGAATMKIEDYAASIARTGDWPRK